MTNQELQTLRNMGNEAEAAAEEIERLRNLLRLVADEPNIDKARALADAEFVTPNAWRLSVLAVSRDA